MTIPNLNHNAAACKHSKSVGQSMKKLTRMQPQWVKDSESAHWQLCRLQSSARSARLRCTSLAECSSPVQARIEHLTLARGRAGAAMRCGSFWARSALLTHASCERQGARSLRRHKRQIRRAQALRRADKVCGYKAAVNRTSGPCKVQCSTRFDFNVQLLHRLVMHATLACATHYDREHRGFVLTGPPALSLARCTRTAIGCALGSRCTQAARATAI